MEQYLFCGYLPRCKGTHNSLTYAIFTRKTSSFDDNDKIAQNKKKIDCGNSLQFDF